MTTPPCATRLEQWQRRIWWLCDCGNESRKSWPLSEDDIAERAAANHVKRRRRREKMMNA